MSDPIAVGDPFPLSHSDIGDCQGVCRGKGGMIAMCVLDEGHGGPHIASNGRMVVEVWRDDD
jgi:hypothetical protein